MGPLQGKCDVICVTDGNFHGTGERRVREFHSSCAAMGVLRAVVLGFEDTPYYHLPLEDLIKQLRAQDEAVNYDLILTHSPTGEYGHINHMDTSLAVHEAFYGQKTVLSVGYQTHSDFVLLMDKAVYLSKFSIGLKHYPDEFKGGFWRDYGSITPAEFYNELELEEVRLITRFLTSREGDLTSLNGGRFEHLIPLLESQKLLGI